MVSAVIKKRSLEGAVDQTFLEPSLNTAVDSADKSNRN